MFNSLRLVTLHAFQELQDSLRSRRAIVVLLLYLGGSITASNFFISFLKETEDTILEGLGLSGTAAVGKVTSTLWETEFFRSILRKIAGDKALADHLVTVPPLAMFNFVITWMLAPLMMMLISSTRVSEELSIGSARFVLQRSSLSSWILGKYFGQALMLFPAMLLSAFGAWLTGIFRLTAFDAADNLIYLLQYNFLLLFYVLAFMGMATGVSQMTRSSNLATCFGFMGIIVSSVLYGASLFYIKKETYVPLWQSIQWLTPQGHRKELLWPDAAHLVPVCTFLFALGLLYILPGYFLLNRRDR